MGYVDNVPLSPRARVLGMMAEKEQEEFAAANNLSSPTKNVHIPGVSPYGTPPPAKSGIRIKSSPAALTALGKAEVDKGYF